MTTPDPDPPLPSDLGVGQADPEPAADLEAQTAEKTTEDADGS